jgi:transcriptional regulator GlxA family with amidase domain
MTFVDRCVVHLSGPDGNRKRPPAPRPIQYQKRLRLQEARRLLLSGASSAEAIAYEVGYASASQFSREYARVFGQPPRRDADESGNVFRY